MWSAYHTGWGIQYTPVVKTVHDPCPAGYSMPPSGAFTGFSPTGGDCSFWQGNIADLSENGVIDYSDYSTGIRGLYFYADATRTSTVFFPCTGYLQIGNLRDNIYENDDENHFGFYQTAGSVYDRNGGYNCALQFRFTSNGLDIPYNLQNGFGGAVRPVINRREVFGGNGDSGATTTGVQVDNYDMGGSMWE